MILISSPHTAYRFVRLHILDRMYRFRTRKDIRKDRVLHVWPRHHCIRLKEALGYIRVRTRICHARKARKKGQLATDRASTPKRTRFQSRDPTGRSSSHN
jgi:hypothetical protein